MPKQVRRFVTSVVSAGGRGAALLDAAIVLVALILSVRAYFGVGGVPGLVIPFAILVLAGFFEREIRRVLRIQELRRLALVQRDAAGTPLDPHEDVGVRPWLGAGPSKELSPFVERRAMEGVKLGLEEKRFVVLVGPETSGKSRLAYEAATEWSEVALVAQPLPSDEDPLHALMDERGGFPALEDDQVLLLTDFAKRVMEGWISGRGVREWLRRNPRIVVIATLKDSEREGIVATATPVRDVWKELEEEAQVVQVGRQLNGAELKDASETFPHLEREQLRELPRYLASGPPLRDALGDMSSGAHGLGCSIVAAVADWRRVGISRPAPLRFVRQIVSRFHDHMDDDQFEEELAWALETRAPDAALIYAAESAGGGLVPDPIVVEIFDHGDTERPIPEFTWAIAISHLKRKVGVGDRSDEEVGRELIELGRAALQQGDEKTAYRAFEDASKLSDFGQRQEIADLVVTAKDSPLVSSRRGDGVFHRLKPVKELAEGRRFAAGGQTRGSKNGPWPFAWIYQRHSLRTVVRIGGLGLADVISTGVGLLVGLWIRAALSDAPGPFAAEGSVSGSFLGLWAAITVFVFAWARLYRKDAARARMSAITAAVMVIAVFGFITTLADDSHVLVAAGAALGGAAIAFALDLALRFLYDQVSRKWVQRHGLEARTLLIGPPRHVATVEKALDKMSRPSIVVGYLSADVDGDPPAVPKAPRLGRPDELRGVVQRYGVGRVILADPGLDPTERQRLADRCHERGLIVEARASLVDIRAGSANFVIGQSLVLMNLQPLWQRNAWFFIKRASDVLFSLAGLLVLGIPLLILWGWMSRQERPGIVRTLRAGVGGEAFYMYRLRTAKGERGARIDLVGSDGSERAKRTRLGSWLRKHAIDELPQLVNVLRGQMSLVGPRPLELRHHVRLSDMQLQRYAVRPGATGPWQVSGQTELTYSELTSVDLAYLRKWSLLTDLEILARTVRLVVMRQKLPRIVDEHGNWIRD